MRISTIALLALAAAACRPTSDPGQPRNEAIIDGEVSDAQDDSTVGVAILSAGGGLMGSCTGVLIGPKLVLTARHCVSRTGEGGVACDADGQSITGGEVSRDYPADQLAVWTGAEVKYRADAVGVQVLHPDSDSLCNNDLSLIVLDKPLTAPIAPIRIDGPPVEGEELLVVGWGVSNNSRGFERRRRSGVPIELVGPAEDRGEAAGPNEFIVGESICSGDSGGPAYAASGAVLGVVSRGGNGLPANETKPYASCVDSGPYKARNLYTRVDGFRELILRGFEAAGDEPWVEGGPDPRKAKMGEACGSGDACRSGVCIGGGKEAQAMMCSQTCDETPGSCPDGFSCRGSEQGNVCQPAGAGGCATAPGGSPGAPAGFLLAIASLGLALARRRTSR